MPQPEARPWAHYAPISHILRDTGLCCLGAGEQQGSPAPVRRRVLGHHAILVITAGTGRFEDAAGSHRIHGPSWLWLDAGRWHSYRPDPAGWSEHWVLVDGIGARAYRPAVRGPGDPVVLPLRMTEDQVAGVFEQLRSATRSPGRTSALRASALVHRLLGELLPGDEDDAVASAVDEVVRSAAEHLTVAQRAARAGITPARLREEIHGRTGMTPHELVLAVRLRSAQSLLAGTDLSITRVAADVGFEDASYFARLFRRRIGLTPREFRAQHRRPDMPPDPAPGTPSP